MSENRAGVGQGAPLDGRTALVTGAARGVGRGVALHLAGLGSRVVLADTAGGIDGRGGDRDLLDLVRDEIRSGGADCLAVATDVTDRAAVGLLFDEVARRFGPVDILVNNAGNMRMGWSWELDEADFASVLAVHLQGQFNCLRRALPGMVERGFGRIVNMTSSGALGHPLHAAYSAAKAGVIGLTQACAVEVSGTGVTVNAFGPSALSRMSSRSIGMSDQELRDAPVDDAGFIGYLVSELAAEVNGQTFLSTSGRPGLVDLLRGPSVVERIRNPVGEDVPWDLADPADAAQVQEQVQRSVQAPGGLARGDAEAYVEKMTAVLGLTNHWATRQTL